MFTVVPHISIISKFESLGDLGIRDIGGGPKGGRPYVMDVIEIHLLL
jgi:hypothetical protein